MEIRDYFAAIRRRLLLLILVPVLATVAALAYALLAPTTYNATATVASSTLVGAPWSQYTGPQGANQFASSFAAESTSANVASAAAAKSGISAKTLHHSVTASQVGASSNMKVALTGKDEANVSAAVEAVASLTLKAMFTPQVTVASDQLSDARTAVRQANLAIARLGEQNHTPDPTSSYQAALNNLSYLQQQQQELRVTGETAEARALQAPISNAAIRVQSFGPLLRKYNDLEATQTSAESGLTTARADLRQSSAQLQAAQASGLISLGSVTSQDSHSRVLKFVVPVLGASIFLTILLVVFLELMSGPAASGANRPTRPADNTRQGPGTSSATTAQDAHLVGVNGAALRERSPSDPGPKVSSPANGVASALRRRRSS